MEEIFRSFKGQIKFSVTAGLISLFILIIIIFLKNYSGTTYSYISDNPAYLLNAPFYGGLLYKMGVVLWCATTSICFFTYTIVRRTSSEKGNFIFFGGLFSLILLVDDFFLIYRGILGDIFHLKQIFISSFYAILAVIFLYKNFRVILKTEFLLLLISFSFLAISLILDLLFDGKLLEIPAEALFENGTMFIGIFFWCFYFVRLAFFEIKRSLQRLHS